MKKALAFILFFGSFGVAMATHIPYHIGPPTWNQDILPPQSCGYHTAWVPNKPSKFTCQTPKIRPNTGQYVPGTTDVKKKKDEFIAKHPAARFGLLGEQTVEEIRQTNGCNEDGHCTKIGWRHGGNCENISKSYYNTDSFFDKQWQLCRGGTQTCGIFGTIGSQDAISRAKARCNGIQYGVIQEHATFQPSNDFFAGLINTWSAFRAALMENANPPAAPYGTKKKAQDYPEGNSAITGKSVQGCEWVEENRLALVPNQCSISQQSQCQRANAAMESVQGGIGAILAGSDSDADKEKKVKGLSSEMSAMCPTEICNRKEGDMRYPGCTSPGAKDCKDPIFTYKIYGCLDKDISNGYACCGPGIPTGQCRQC